MTGETVSAATIMNAPAEAIVAVLADPAGPAAIDGTGGARESVDGTPLTAAGQVFGMAMDHAGHRDGSCQVATRIQEFDPPSHRASRRAASSPASMSE